MECSTLMTFQIGFQGADNGRPPMFSQSTHSLPEFTLKEKGKLFSKSNLICSQSWREGHVCLTKRPNLFALFLKRSINHSFSRQIMKCDILCYISVPYFLISMLYIRPSPLHTHRFCILQSTQQCNMAVTSHPYPPKN